MLNSREHITTTSGMSANEGDARADAVAIEIAPEQTPVEPFADTPVEAHQPSTWEIVTAGLNQVALMDVGGGIERASYIPAYPGREVEDQLAELLKAPEASAHKRPIDKITALMMNKIVLVPKPKEGEPVAYQDLDKIKKEKLVNMVMEDGGMDNLVMMRKMKERYDALGMSPPGVEVRFEHLKVTADVEVGSRGMPGLTNDLR